MNGFPENSSSVRILNILLILKIACQENDETCDGYERLIPRPETRFISTFIVVTQDKSQILI